MAAWTGDSTSHSWEVSSRSFLGGHQLSEWELSYFSSCDSSAHSQTSLVPASPRLPAPSKSRESPALMLPRAYRARKSSDHTTSIPWACRLVNLREAAVQKHRYQFPVPQINQGGGREEETDRAIRPNQTSCSQAWGSSIHTGCGLWPGALGWTLQFLKHKER